GADDPAVPHLAAIDDPMHDRLGVEGLAVLPRGGQQGRDLCRRKVILKCVAEGGLEKRHHTHGMGLGVIWARTIGTKPRLSPARTSWQYVPMVFYKILHFLQNSTISYDSPRGFTGPVARRPASGSARRLSRARTRGTRGPRTKPDTSRPFATVAR